MPPTPPTVARICRLLSTSSSSPLPRSSTRHFTSTSRHVSPTNGHRTYFQRDSSPYTAHSLAHPTQQQQQQQHYGANIAVDAVSATTQPHRFTTSPPRSTSNTLSFLAGLIIALPTGILLSMYLLTTGWVPGWEASSDSEVMSDLMSAEAALQETRNTVNGLNQAEYRTHKLLFDLLTPSLNLRIVRDDALLRSRPVTLANGRPLNPADAVLIRVVDNAGKNRGLILAYGNQNDPVARSEDWEPDWSVVDWLDKIGKRLHADGLNAYFDIPMLVYTPEFLGVYKGAMEGFIWTRLENRDFPPGFPLRQLREAEEVVD